MRINKFLATVGIASRRKCDKLIETGAIKVNGKVINKLGMQIDENKDIVEYNDKVLKLPHKFVYYKLNKPKGYICSTKDTANRKTVYNLVKVDGIRLFSAGRLDYDTEGFLILTNDGDFAQKLIHPSSEINKEYYCTIEGPIKESELAVLRAGVVINNTRLPSAKVKVLSREISKVGIVLSTKLSIIINEGQNRQIRRMLDAIGRNIKLLRRVRIADIKLGGLKRGEYKELTEGELACIGFSM